MYNRTPLRVRFDLQHTPEPNTGCWLWTGALRLTGYGGIGLTGKYLLAHRVAFELFVGPIPRGKFVLHRCDVRACVNPSHLFLGTNADNMRDMARKERGRPLGRVPIRRHEAALIQFLHDCGVRPFRLAALFGIRRRTLRSIISRENFSGVFLRTETPPRTTSAPTDSNPTGETP